MTDERNQQHNYNQALHDQCKQYMFHHVIITMTDGSSMDGIIENVGTDDITVLVGEDVAETDNGGFGYGYGGYGLAPRGRYRRYRRRTFPLLGLSALALLPFALSGAAYGGYPPYGGYPAYPPYPYYPYY